MKTLRRRIQGWVKNVQRDRRQVNRWRSQLKRDKADAEAHGYTADRRKRIIEDRRQLKQQAAHLREAENTLHKLRAQANLTGEQHKRLEATRKALSFVGRHEDPGRPNQARWLDAWARRVGTWMIGQSWCGLFVWTIALLVGVRLDKRTVSTIAIRDMARAGKGGYRRWKSIAHVRVGDFVVYGFPASAGPMHVGMYVGGGRVVEGNTSGRGSQNDGGGVYIKTIAERRPYILGVAEPAY